MILAIPQQRTTVASGIGIPEYTTVLTSWRFWCSVCRYSPQDISASHAELALRQGDYHLRTEQCHLTGQLELFAVAGGAR